MQNDMSIKSFRLFLPFGDVNFTEPYRVERASINVKTSASSYADVFPASESLGAAILSGQICGAAAFVLFLQKIRRWQGSPIKTQPLWLVKIIPVRRAGGRNDEGLPLLRAGQFTPWSVSSFWKICFAKRFSMPLK